LTLETLRKLWKNEYFQTAITILLLLMFVFGFWYIAQIALGTEYPALAVASESMLPTLNVGDLIIVQGVPPEQINANYLTGDIIVFKNVRGDLIVHRAVESEQRDDGYYFVTHGDNNRLGSNEGPFHQRYVVGKVIARVPWIGNLALLMHSHQNIYLFTVFIIILIVILFIFPFEADEEVEESREKMMLGKIPIKVIYVLILNLLLIGFILFSLWGAFTFWNPGAGTSSQGMHVTIYGMFSDVGFHENFQQSHNNISMVTLDQGFLTYVVNCFVSDGTHEGWRRVVPTFSWAQAAIIILVALDVWEFMKILRSKKKVEA